MHLPRLLLAVFMTGFTLLTSLPAVAASPRSLMVAGKEVQFAFQGLSAKASTSKYGGIMVHVMGPDGKPLNTVSKMFIESAGKNAAMKFKPSELAKKMTMGKMMASTVSRWPIESFGFALAIGAITTAQLFFDYSNNPVGMQQHLEYQKDPVGHVGFLAFMMANGVSHHTMTQILGDKTMTTSRFRHFFPFLGMSVGMVASNIVHEVGHFPGLKECAFAKPGSKEKDAACDKAYEAWLDLDAGEKMHEWAPGLMSLAASFFISGAIMSVASKVIKISAVEVAAMIVPGGVHIKVVRGVMWLVNMTIFTGIDTVIASMIQTPYRNWHKGNKLEGHEVKLYYALAGQKNAKWKTPVADECFATPYNSLRTTLGYDKGEYCKSMFPGIVRQAGEALKDWRDFNLEPVMFAQANWNQYLGNLSSMYGATKEFYKFFLNDVWQKKYGPYKNAEGYTFPMDRKYPLHGIKPLGLTAEFRGDFLTNPTQIAEMQMEHVNKLVMAMESKKDLILKGLAKEDHKEFNEVLSDLRKSYRNTENGLMTDEALVGKVMEKITIATRKSSTRPALKSLYATILNSLGRPYPLKQSGQGYAQYYRIHPEFGAFLDELPYQRIHGALETKAFAESMWAAMFWGPNAESGARSIYANSLMGLPATFNPPSVVQKAPYFSASIAPQPVERQSFKFDFYNYHVTTGSGKTFKNHGTMFDYLSEGNIRPEILNEKPDSVATWWKTYPETEYFNAFLKYEDTYYEIVVNLLERMWRKDLSGIENPIPKDSIFSFMNPALRSIRKFSIAKPGSEKSSFGPLKENGDSTFNGGPVSNGTVEALDQEKKMYLMVAGEMFKDLYQEQNQDQASFRAEFSNKTLKGLDVKASEADMDAQALPILRVLRQSDNLQFAHLSAKFSKLRNKQFVGKEELKNLKWQDAVEDAFANVEQVLSQIKPREVFGKDGKAAVVPTTHVSMAQINEVKEQAAEAVRAAKADIESKLTLTVYQKSILDTCFEGLDNLLNEMVTYGQIANAVSWVEQSGASNGWIKPHCGEAQGKRSTGPMSVKRAVEGC